MSPYPIDDDDEIPRDIADAIASYEPFCSAEERAHREAQDAAMLRSLLEKWYALVNEKARKRTRHEKMTPAAPPAVHPLEEI